MKKSEFQRMTEQEFNERVARELRRFKRRTASDALREQAKRLRQLWRIAVRS